MSELLSLIDVPAIPSTMDSIYTSSSDPLTLTAASLHKILRRTRSGGYPSSFQGFRKLVTPDKSEYESGGESEEENEDESEDESWDEGEYARSRTNSPVRANSKRRRSAAGTPYPGLAVESHAIDTVRPVMYLALRCGIEPHRAIVVRREAERGDVTIDLMLAVLDEAKVASMISGVAVTIKGASPYITKGAFRLSSDTRLEEFRFPKYRSQPEPTWRPGDGFSDDEAKLDSVFPMKGKRKRKWPRPHSALGQLSLETENTGYDSVAGVTPSWPRSIGSHGSEGRAHRTEVRELWPTRENFMESPIVKQLRKTGAKKSSIVGSTPSLNLGFMTLSKPQMKQAVPRKRQASDFENFGKRKGKPRSCHRTVLQGHGPDINDEENMKERNGMYEQPGDESERESVADEELGDTRTAMCSLEGSDNGSVILGESISDGEDEGMQNTVPDSQSDEESSRGLGISKGYEAYLTDLARRSLSNCRAPVEDTMSHS
ncbi:hypothetical protein GQX73_g6218 [Xylaria multiplex]|uniref:Uncharacterized protein n=1 Tax=Xylaria multiplex TaxID=323545 RepID=A0A7C8N3F5_9PEZI|nr:hypothetical protein GQX73_g6218 [Xylaria multiplex]